LQADLLAAVTRREGRPAVGGGRDGDGVCSEHHDASKSCGRERASFPRFLGCGAGAVQGSGRAMKACAWLG
jgi:hypothetical protein